MTGRQNAPPIELDTFTAADDPAALALERRLTQGDPIRISFHRQRFAARAERFDRHRIVVARSAGRLVGTCAIGFKRMAVQGRTVAAAMLFDWRVDPAARRGGTALELLRYAGGLALAEADLVYSWVLEENRASHGSARFIGARHAGNFRLLVYPTHRHRHVDCSVEAVERAVLLAELRRSEFEFAPVDQRDAGLVGAFLARDGSGMAGCSVWTMQDVLGEVVEGLPPHLALLGRLQSRWPVSRLPIPHIPRPGERVRSWYVCDLFSSTPSLACQLVRHVAAWARESGIDFCNVVGGERESWFEGVTRDHWKLFSPILRYRLMMRWKDASRATSLTRIWVDALDI